MNLNHQIFSGIFGDEIGQRYLTMFGHVTENAYSDLCETCGPTQQRRLRECLLKVPGWDKSVITSEIEKITKNFPDYAMLFKQTYINYVKAMRGGNHHIKIMINLPKFESVFHSYLKQVADHKFMKEGKYFLAGPLEQKCVCMECIRNTLYDYLGDEYVKIETKHRAQPRVTPKSAPIKEEEETGGRSDCEDSIIPEDSVSQLGYSARRDRDKSSDRSSDVSRSKKDTDSLSLSSVTLSQTERTRNRSEDVLSNARLSTVSDARRKDNDRMSDTGRSSLKYDTHRDERFDERSETYKSSRDERFDKRSETYKSGRDERFDNRSETYKSGRDEGSDTQRSHHSRKDRYSYESEDEKSDHHDDREETTEDSSEDEADSPVKKRSPCRSYVTQLTEDSRMTNE